MKGFLNYRQTAKLIERIPKLPLEPKLVEDYVDFPSSFEKIALGEVEKDSLLLLSYREVIDLLKKLGLTQGLTGDPVAIMSEPEPEKEEAFEYGVVANWFSRMGVQHYRIRVSGHYYPFEIETIKEVLKPKRVVPVHTENPEP